MKEVSSIWELGGGAKIANLISTPLSAENIEYTSLIVFLDLTNPSQIPDTVFNLMHNVVEKVTDILKGINNVDPERFDRLEKVINKFKEHKDAASINVLPFPVTFVAARYDQFQNMESEKKKLIYKFIRYVAHINGANIMVASKSLWFFQNFGL